MAATRRIPVVIGAASGRENVMFAWLAFCGVFCPSVVWSISWAKVLVKRAVPLVSLPGIYPVRPHST